MPNGRSGGFVIETADLKQLVQAVSGDTVVGKLFTNGPNSPAACAAEIVQLIEDCPHERFPVEEQDRAYYIIHFSNDRNNIRWVVINSTSPLFTELRNRHTRWMAEHPSWLGWVEF